LNIEEFVVVNWKAVADAVDALGGVEIEVLDSELDELNKYVESTAELLDESQELNFKRWDILDKKVHQNYQALGSYEAEVKTVKDYITTRLQTLDALIRK
jgi:hypothetical protein